MQSLRSVALLASLPALCAAAVTQHGIEQKKAFRACGGGGIVRPLSYDQRLLICNAYPSESPMLVKKNGQVPLADAGRPLSFRECRYANGHVQQHDKLDLMLRDVEVHGTFEVGALPASDALLLLVLQRRQGSPLVSFQSFAFPERFGRGDAQLVLIDAFQGKVSGSASHLRVEDHSDNRTVKAASRRVEQLSFSRIYALEAGTYDATVARRPRGGNSTGKVPAELHAPQTFRLLKDKNYVVIRTGDEDHFGESLLVFPPEELQSGSRAPAPAWFLAGVLAALAWAGA